MSRAKAILLCAAGFGLVLGSAEAGTPRVGLIAKTWEVDFEFHDLQRLTMTLPGDTQPTTYWYMLYRVTNDTGREIEFYPSFRLVTDTLKTVTGGDMISPHVYNVIAGRHLKQYPFFRPASKVTGPLLQGRENARTSAVVFREFDLQASGLTVFISGLSGDVERLSNPAFDASRGESDENPRFFLFRRTLAIKYDLPGDPVTQAQAVPVRRSREWIMR